MKTIRINKVLRELNISLDRAVEFLNEKGHVIESRPTAKISQKEYDFLLEEFQTDRTKREASNEVYEVKKKEKEAQIQEAIEKAQKHETLAFRILSQFCTRKGKSKNYIFLRGRKNLKNV